MDPSTFWNQSSTTTWTKAFLESKGLILRKYYFWELGNWFPTEIICSENYFGQVWVNAYTKSTNDGIILILKKA